MDPIIKRNGLNTYEFQPTYAIPKTWRNWLIGRPLATADAPHQTIGRGVGLAVFASDALSSTAYATQEILAVLAVAGTAAFEYSIPIAIAIALLMAIVTISYEQTIHAYPGGGGAYIVARDNLGELPAQAAGAALLTDYILTVAVSISSGVAQIVSAYPQLNEYRVWIAVSVVVFIMIINLRGVKESGITFAIPTYFFVTTMLVTVLVGLFRYFTGSLGMVIDPPHLEQAAHTAGSALVTVTPFLLLHAFANGTSALTGIEAISNGITAFKEPRSRNAGITLIWMSVILGSLFLSITFLARHIGAIPSETETVISQIARTIYADGSIFYLSIIAGTALILLLAANTAFADFPRLGALHAGDGFLPRQLTYRGSRLVYSWGIVSLTIISSLLIILFQASVTRLIPLYAIGVFLSFTLSQVGMARRWWKSGHLQADEELHEPGSILKYDQRWLIKLLINGFGATSTFIVMIVFGVTKFTEGAWIIILLVPTLVYIFFSIHRHYKNIARNLSLEKDSITFPYQRNRVILLVSGVHQGSLAALRYARRLSSDVTAVHVSTDPQESKKIQEKWDKFGEDCRLVILQSPYRLMIEPVLEYLAYLTEHKSKHEIITIVIPTFTSKEPWSQFLHMRTAETFRKVLREQENLVIIEVPYQVH
ncbi:MAG TPA: APC family permease [Anaerolineales bacterium]|nr:APC family permease [Anaerolineales bacterium]